MTIATHTARPDLLEAIVAATRRTIALRKFREPVTALETRAARRQPQRERFHAALSAPSGINVIAECKRRSPSRGVLRRNYDPVAIAKSYESAGAAVISVLTEPSFFDGSLDHLNDVRSAVSVPLLRKDFIVDEYQLLEARAHGADAVLLIVSALSDDDLHMLQHQAHGLGLATLIEVHDAGELDRAVAADAKVIGVNNRNLRTLEVDTSASERLAREMPAGVLAVSESGLRTTEELTRLRNLGYRAFLIGEHFMTASNPGDALGQVLGTAGLKTDRRGGSRTAPTSRHSS
jgi:indole-3-glycerol phosphate synthase